jgi:hypothetical protein
MRISYLIFAAGPALLVFFLLISYTPANPNSAAVESVAATEIMAPAPHGKMCALRDKIRETSCAIPAEVGSIPRIASR